MIIDVHCHYTLTRRAPAVADRFSFEPAGHPAPPDPARTDVPPTAFDSCVSPRALGRLDWRLARWWLGYATPGVELDLALERDYAFHFGLTGGAPAATPPAIMDAVPVDRFVLLAFDAVHDDDGKIPPLPRHRRALGSDIYSSNSFVRALCRVQPQRFHFGASVHPYRTNAPDLIDEVFAAGASLLKWLPLHHNIDPADERTRAVLRRCAALGLPVLIHCGPEYTLKTHRPAYRPLAPWIETLRALRKDGALPTTIFAHCATPVVPWGDRTSWRLLWEVLTKEFADTPVYADVSAMLTPGKVGFLRALLREPALHGKLLWGSDFPVPTPLWRIRRDLGRTYGAVARIASWPQRAAVACRTLGLSDIVFRHAAQVLANVR